MTKRNMLARAGAVVFMAGVLAGPLWSNWPQWRGPNSNGSAPAARDLPVTWTESNNVLWRTKLPSWSAATPVVWQNTIFVTSAQEGFTPLRGGSRAAAAAPDKIFLLAVNRKTV